MLRKKKRQDVPIDFNFQKSGKWLLPRTARALGNEKLEFFKLLKHPNFSRQQNYETNYEALIAPTFFTIYEKNNNTIKYGREYDGKVATLKWQTKN